MTAVLGLLIFAAVSALLAWGMSKVSPILFNPFSEGWGNLLKWAGVLLLSLLSFVVLLIALVRFLVLILTA